MLDALLRMAVQRAAAALGESSGQTWAANSPFFMPLSFITGLYGMNFKYMPELNMRYGYPITIAVMAVIVLAMIYYFKKKKWF